MKLRRICERVVKMKFHMIHLKYEESKKQNLTVSEVMMLLEQMGLLIVKM